MSNIFNRLVSQQLNTTSARIRPLASLPFHKTPGFSEDEGSLVAPTNRDERAFTAEIAYEPTPTQRVEPATNPALTPDERQPVSSPSPLMPGGTSEPEYERTETSFTSTPGTNPAVPQFPELLIRVDDIPTSATETSAASPAPRLMEPAGLTAPPIASKAASISPESSTAQPEQPSPQTQDAATRSQTPNIITEEKEETSTNQLPAPLLPRHETSQAKSATQQTGLKRQSNTNASKSAGTEPNEVHIHIGRIEVTALQPEAASKERQKPRSKRGQQPMSLDDYLAKRQRGDR